MAQDDIGSHSGDWDRHTPGRGVSEGIDGVGEEGKRRRPQEAGLWRCDNPGYREGLQVTSSYGRLPFQGSPRDDVARRVKRSNAQNAPFTSVRLTRLGSR